MKHITRMEKEFWLHDEDSASGLLRIFRRGTNRLWTEKYPSIGPDELTAGGLFREAIESGTVGIQAAATGPVAELLDLFRRRVGHRHYMLGSLLERDSQQGRQAAAGPDLGPRPVLIGRKHVFSGNAIQLPIDCPDGFLLLSTGEIEKDHGIEAFGPGKFRREPADIIAGGDQIDIRLVVIHPGEEGPEESGRHATIGLATGGTPTEGLFHLIDKEDAGGHGIGDPQGTADILLGLTDQRTVEAADVQDEDRPTGLFAQGLGKGALPRPGDTQ